MKVSVVTICYNNASEIRKTIESVVNQTYRDLEYIIVDGGSKDDSLSIINGYKDRISTIISEPDKGIYDALNKGVRNATGDVVGFIHAGDLLFDNEVIGKIAKFFSENDVDVSYGGSQTITEEGKVVRMNPGLKRPYNWAIKTGWMPSHMSMYCKRELFEKYGYYRLDMPVAGDYEWFLRYFYKHKNKLKIKLLDEYILYFSLGGVSSQDGVKKLGSKQKKMLDDCWLVNGLKPLPILVYLRPLWTIRIILKCKLNHLFKR